MHEYNNETKKLTIYERDTILNEKYSQYNAIKSLSINGPTVVHRSAFEGFSNLEYLYIGNDVKEIRHSAFKGCRALSHIILDNNHLNIHSKAFINVGNKAFNRYDNAYYIGNTAVISQTLSLLMIYLNKSYKISKLIKQPVRFVSLDIFLYDYHN